MTKRILTVAAADPPAPAQFLVKRMNLAPDEARTLVEAGAVAANGRRLTSNVTLKPGDRVAVNTPSPRALDEPRIAYVDDWLLVVDKPPGWLSQPSPSDGQSLESWLAPQHRLARLVHRIDRETSGLVLFSLRTEAHRPLQRLLTTGRLLRLYTAIVDGQLEGQGVIELRIARHPSDTTRRQWLPANAPGGLPALTHFENAHRLADLPNRSRVDLRLHSGRTHQARLHLAGIGHPVVGDLLYGGSGALRLHLHARRLELPHPRDGRSFAVEAPMPELFG